MTVYAHARSYHHHLRSLYHRPLTYKPKRAKDQEKMILVLASTNLPFRYWPNPAQRQVDRDSHDANDPEDLMVVLVVVAEYDGKDDAAQVTRRAGDA